VCPVRWETELVEKCGRTELLIDLVLDGQAVAVPAKATHHVMSSGRRVPGDHVLQHASSGLRPAGDGFRGRLTQRLRISVRHAWVE
jgi:hypothetical protein